MNDKHSAIDIIARGMAASGGGTVVEANPTLSGNEADLTGIQIGDTKYKAIGIHKYQHYITLKKPISYLTTLPTVYMEKIIINNNPTAFTAQTFMQTYSNFRVPCRLGGGSTFADGIPIEFSLGKFQQTWTVTVMYQRFTDGVGTFISETSTNDGTISNIFTHDEVTQLS